MKYKTEIVIEAIRLKEAGVTTSAISKKLLAPSSTIVKRQIQVPHKRQEFGPRG